MGQRLNLEIRKDGKVLANAYYHWGAYTGSAFARTEYAYNFLEANKDVIKDDRLLAIRALEATGAGLPLYEDGTGDLGRIRNIRKYFDTTFAKFNGRNEGIITCFKDSIENTQSWAEGTAAIELNNMSIYFDVFCYYDSADEIKEYIDDNFDDKDAVVFNYNWDELSIGELSEIVDTLCSGKWIKLDDQYLCELG